MMRTTCTIQTICVLVLVAGLAAGQQTNSTEAGLDLNGSSASGSAPYAAVIEQPNPLQITITGTANQPFLLIAGSGIDLQNMDFPAGQIDVGPSNSIVVDGLQGPFSPYFANTGPSGSQVFQIDVPTASVALGSVLAGLQALVIDPTSPFNVSFSAASTFSFVANSGANAQPIANAGVSTYVDGGRCVTLDGSGSSDPEAAALTYNWTQIAGTTVTLSSNTDVMPTFTAPTGPETLVFELVVNDGTQDSLVSTVYIPVQVAATTVSFATNVFPIFGAGGLNCASCHTAPFAGGGMELDGTSSQVYAMISMQVSGGSGLTGLRANPCDPANSPILLKPLAFAVSGVSHGGGDLMADTMDANYVTILTWLMEGAQNN